MMLRRLSLGTTHVVLCAGFLDGHTCAATRASMDAGAHQPAEIYDEGYRVDPDVRSAFDVDVDDGTIVRFEGLLAAARGEIGKAFELPLTGSEGPGFLRYRQGGFYRRHQDALEIPSGDFPRRLSLVVFLTGSTASDEAGSYEDACAGGELRLHGMPTGEPYDIRPERGLLVVFPAHIPHEVLPVTRGVRDVVVDWFY